MSKQTNNCIIFLPCPAGPGRAELHRGGGVPGLGGVRAAGGSRDPRGQGARSPEGDLQVRPRNFVDTFTEHPHITLLSLLVSRSDPIDSRFALLLEDFSPAGGWRQDRLLGPAAARATLAAFARLHAFFWQGSAFWRRGGEV